MKINNQMEKKYKNYYRKQAFDPFRLVSDEEFSRNMGAVIAYYQMTKGEAKRRFVSSDYYDNLDKIEFAESFNTV